MKPALGPVELRPVDVPVALRLAEHPEAKFGELARDLGISVSTAHAAVQRLEYAALLRPGTRTVNWLFLRDFLRSGLRFAFPARPGERARGVPTGYAAPPLANHIRFEEPVVWPAPDGPATGPAIQPLYARAPELPWRCPSLYELVAMADALRFGLARERNLAMQTLEARLGPRARAGEPASAS